MARTKDVADVDWTAVIARTLAFLCVRQAQMEDETLVEQAVFLERFGIPRAEAAEILGTSLKSLNEMERQQKDRRAKGRPKKTSTRKSTSARAGRGARAR